MTISFVDQIIAGSGVADLNFPSGSSQAITVKSPAPAMAVGDTIVLAVLTESSNVAATTPATDTRGNVYSRVADQPFGTLNTGLDIICAPVSTVLQAGDTITVNLASGVPAIIFGAVFRGLSAGLLIDGTYQGANDQFASAWTTGAVTTTAQPELALALAGTGGAVATFTDTPNASWTDLCAASGTNCPRSLVFQYRITSATGSITPGGTFKSAGAASNQSYNAGFVVIKAASAGGGSATVHDTVSISSTVSTGSTHGGTATAGDAVTVSDAVTVAGNAWLVAIADTVTITDTAAGVHPALRTAGDTVTVSDAAATSSTHRHAVTATGTVGITDAAASASTLHKSATVGTTVTLSDNIAAVQGRRSAQTVSSTIAVGDTAIVSTSRTFFAMLADSLTITDQVAVTYIAATPGRPSGQPGAVSPAVPILP